MYIQHPKINPKCDNQKISVTTIYLQLGNSALRPYVCVGSFDGELAEPLVVVDQPVAGLGGDQLTAQHPPGQTEVHHTLHRRGPVVQRHKTWQGEILPCLIFILTLDLRHNPFFTQSNLREWLQKSTHKESQSRNPNPFYQYLLIC